MLFIKIVWECPTEFVCLVQACVLLVIKYGKKVAFLTYNFALLKEYTAAKEKILTSNWFEQKKITPGSKRNDWQSIKNKELSIIRKK